MDSERGADRYFQEFRDAGALLEGHFVLSSGLHTASYLQCARVFMEPARGERLCAALAERLAAADIMQGVTAIVSPAMGGVLAGYEMARQLWLPCMFFERVSGVFTLRRGFELGPGDVCLLVEDVVTTGLSCRECIAAAAALGAEVKAVAALVDRSGGRAVLPVPLLALVSLDIPVYPPDHLPHYLSGIPVQQPGSRILRS